jgi:hypothetical protein
MMLEGVVWGEGDEGSVVVLCFLLLSAKWRGGGGCRYMTLLSWTFHSSIFQQKNNVMYISLSSPEDISKRFFIHVRKKASKN